ncbi:hypothetical protein ACVWZV_004513 [Bradyrhizobium sp. GM5.1]
MSKHSSKLLQQARLLFDPEFYAVAYPGVSTPGIDLFKEYLTIGWRQGRDPNPRFSTKSYLAENPDVAATGQCPLLHYARYGVAEGRYPRPRSNTAP